MNKAQNIFRKYISVFLLIAGLYMVPLRLFESDFDKIPGDLGDSRFNNYILEHGFLFFSGKTSAYWNASFMYPEKDVISYSDNLLGTLPIYSVFRILHFDRETSFQGWILIIFILNYVCSYLVFKKFRLENLSAAVGAYIFTFSIPVIGQLNHQQILPCFMMPWAFWGLINYFRTLKMRPLLICALSVALQFYCGMYMGFLLSLALLIVAIVYFLVHLRKSDNDDLLDKKTNYVQQLKYILSAGLIFLLVLYPIIKPYYERSVVSGMKKYEEIITTLPVIQSYLNPYNGSIPWHFLFKLVPHPDNYWDHFLYPGGLALISFIAAFFIFIFNKNQNKLLLVFWISLLFLITLTLKSGHQDFSLFKYIRILPGFSSLRALNRIILVELFFFAIITAFVAEYLLKRTKNSFLIYILLPVVIIADQAVSAKSFMRFSKKESQQRVNVLMSKIEIKDYKKYNAFIYMPEATELDYMNQIDGMLASQSLNFPTVNGYTASYPSNYYNLIWHNDDKSLDEWLNSKDVNRSQILIVH